MTSIRHSRSKFTTEKHRLQRARNLFVWLYRHEIQDLGTLEMVADSMIIHGLYWPGADTQSIAYSVIKRLYTLYFGKGMPLDHWWAWMERFEWCGSRTWSDSRAKQAALVFPFSKLPWQ